MSARTNHFRAPRKKAVAIARASRLESAVALGLGFLAILAALAALGAIASGLPSAHAGEGAYCPMPAPAAGVTPPVPRVGDVVLADMNMRIDPSCDAFALSDGPSGDYGLVRTTHDALNEGIACLNANGARDPIARLRKILSPGGTPRPNMLVCGHNGGSVTVYGATAGVTDIAAAILPSSAGFPSVIFNLDWIAKAKSRSLKAALFHELFHTAGYDHEHNVDVPYFAAGCCFEDSTAACDLLKKSEGKSPTWWTTADYLKDAVAWFYGRDEVASSLLLAVADASPDDLSGARAGLLQLGDNEKRLGSLSDVAKQELGVRCLAAGGGASCEAIFGTNDLSYTRRVAELVALRSSILARQKRGGSAGLTPVERLKVSTLRSGFVRKCADLTGGQAAFDRLRDENAGPSDAPELRAAFQSLCR